MQAGYAYDGGYQKDYEDAAYGFLCGGEEPAKEAHHPAGEEAAEEYGAPVVTDDFFCQVQEGLGGGKAYIWPNVYYNEGEDESAYYVA